MSDTQSGGHTAAAKAATNGAISPLAALSPSQPAQDVPPRSQGRLPLITVVYGHLLKKARIRSGLSRERLSWKSGVGITTIARLERQRVVTCRPKSLILVARALGEQPASLVPAEEAIVLHLVPASQPDAGEPASTDNPAALSA